MIACFQIVVFTSFIGYIWMKYGVQSSISDSWYALGKSGPLFTLFLWIIGVSMCTMGNLWYFLAGSCLCFTGGAAEFKQRITSKVHVVGAIGGISLSLLGLWIDGVRYPAVVFLLTAVILYKLQVPKVTWWVEISAFAAIETGFLWP